MQQKLISVILPVYNGERYLRTSIESCIWQTYKNWELLIIDDGSTDRTAEIAGQYEAADPRIRYFRNPQNLRLPRTLNRGFSLSAGDYLTWTSDDNYYAPEALEKMAAVLDGQKGQFVFAGIENIDENGRRISLGALEFNRSMICGFNIVGACFMYTRQVYQAVGDYDPDCEMAEDYDYWLRIFQKFPVVHIPEILYAYRQHPGALTERRKRSQYQAVEKLLLRYFPSPGKLSRLERYYLYSGLHLRRALEPSVRARYRYLLPAAALKIWHRYLYRNKDKRPYEELMRRLENSGPVPCPDV